MVTNISFHAGFVNDLINMVCGHARPYCSPGFIEYLSAQPADFSHAFDPRLVEYLYVVSSEQLLLRTRIAIFTIVWPFYRRWKGSCLGQWVDRSKWASKRISWERIVCPAFWIDLRNHFGGNNGSERVCTFMY